MYFSTQSIRSAIVLDASLDKDTLKCSSFSRLSMVVTVKATVTSDTPTDCSLNLAMKELSDLLCLNSHFVWFIATSKMGYKLQGKFLE